ncbi:MAG: hypothetical protein H6557_17980 [Lewinellaceae bacterium]|nr:hypothetical protein [Phaeodactylibacter sp.]MCB9038502.1 hypothetical protein [Lewinellaceae bacterium]
MNPPFTREQFLEVFRAYNEAVFPAQYILYLIAFAVLFFLFRRRPGSSKAIAALLAAMWIWTGIAYHWLFFTTINTAAYGFGALFVLQGVVFLYFGFRDKLSFAVVDRFSTIVAWILLTYALILYPLVGRALGHFYPEAPTFGLPCPLTIFTFGMLLLTNRHVPRWVLAIPTIWALVGSTAVFAFGIYQDLGLLTSAVIAWAFFLFGKAPTR